jgi:hypothetical protein
MSDETSNEQKMLSNEQKMLSNEQNLLEGRVSEGRVSERREEVKVYRYKFTQEFMDEMHNFSKIHQYDDRIQFKEAWDKWVIDYEDSIQTEVERLLLTGYTGDILDKMFKSARYYFRKKGVIKPDVKERRPYILLQKEILDLMDVHIRRNNYKPSEGFEDFCNLHVDNLKQEIAYLFNHNITDTIMIKDKFKKTYKNRYFLQKDV